MSGIPPMHVAPGVVPVIIGPLQALLALLPGMLLLIAVGLVILAGLSVGTWFAVRRLKRGKPALVIIMACVYLVLLAGSIAINILLVATGTWPERHPFLGPAVDTVPEATSSESADWTAFRGGPARLGYVPGSAEPADGDLHWSFVDTAADIRTVYSSPTIVGNRVYVTTAKWELFSKSGSLCCIDADTAGVVWRYGEKYLPTFSSPAVSGKFLVVGEGLHETMDARVMCFDVKASEATRKAVKLWEYRTKSHVESSPCIADGRVCVGAGADGLYCFALEPNADGSAKVLWHLEGGPGSRYPDCESSPVIVDGKVYFGLGIDGNAVVCVDAVSGEELWRVKTPYPVFAGPTVAGGKLYVGMGHGDFVNYAEELGKPPAGEVWCIDLATRNVDWTFQAKRAVLGSAAVDGDRLYFGSRDRYLYCLKTDGSLVRKWQAKSTILASPAVGPKCVYVVPSGNRVVAIDKTTMKPAWQATVGTGLSLGLSSPAVARGHVYVGSAEDGLVCLGTSTNATPGPGQ